MRLEDNCTVLVGLDEEHFREFKWSFPTWERNWPECMEMPWLFVVDVDQRSVAEWGAAIGELCPSLVFRAVGFPRFTHNQRYHMLSSLVWASSMCVETEWFVKIDTDTLRGATDVPWYDPAWLSKDIQFATHRWGYTKSIAMWRKLKKWAVPIPRPEVDGVEVPEKDRVKHRRIISFWMLCRTAFAQRAWDMIDGSLLPIPSQDTFLWYVAERLGLKYVAGNMKKRGWQHTRKVEQAAKEILDV